MTEASTGSAAGQMVPDDGQEAGVEVAECPTFLKSERLFPLVIAARARAPPPGLSGDVAINDGIAISKAIAVGLPLADRIVVGLVEGEAAIVVGLNGVAAIVREDAAVAPFAVDWPAVVLTIELTLGGAVGRSAAPNTVPRAIAVAPGITISIPTTSVSNVDDRLPRLSALYGLASLIRDSSCGRPACDAISIAPAAERAIEFLGY